MANVAIKNEKITAFGGINFVLDKFDALLGEVIETVSSASAAPPQATNTAKSSVLSSPSVTRRSTRRRRGRQLLPLRRLAAAYVHVRGGGHGQGEELPLPLHRSARQVGQDGKAERAQHLFQKALRPHLG